MNLLNSMKQPTEVALPVNIAQITFQSMDNIPSGPHHSKKRKVKTFSVSFQANNNNNNSTINVTFYSLSCHRTSPAGCCCCFWKNESSAAASYAHITVADVFVSDSEVCSPSVCEDGEGMSPRERWGHNLLKFYSINQDELVQRKSHYDSDPRMGSINGECGWVE